MNSVTSRTRSRTRTRTRSRLCRTTTRTGSRTSPALSSPPTVRQLLRSSTTLCPVSSLNHLFLSLFLPPCHLLLLIFVFTRTLPPLPFPFSVSLPCFALPLSSCLFPPLHLYSCLPSLPIHVFSSLSIHFFPSLSNFLAFSASLSSSPSPHALYFFLYRFLLTLPFCS